MRTSRSLVAALALTSVGACASSTYTRDVGPSRPRPIATPVSTKAARGPDVRISASYSTWAVSRYVRANFHVDENAYVFVAHVGPTGDIRVLFPTTPTDDGLVEGGRTYGIPEFSAGQYSQYASRYAFTSSSYLPLAARTLSYDGGAGYIFVI